MLPQFASCNTRARTSSFRPMPNCLGEKVKWPIVAHGASEDAVHDLRIVSKFGRVFAHCALAAMGVQRVANFPVVTCRCGEADDLSSRPLATTSSAARYSRSYWLISARLTQRDRLRKRLIPRSNGKLRLVEDRACSACITLLLPLTGATRMRAKVMSLEYLVQPLISEGEPTSRFFLVATSG
jgi:hypothetical protein